MSVKDQDFSLEAKKRMLDMGMTVSALARKLRLSRMTVSQAINHRLHKPTLRRICRELGLKQEVL